MKPAEAEHPRLSMLVVATLDSGGTLKAVQLYGQLQSEHPDVLRREKVRGFRSFVKILNQLPDIAQESGSGVKQYVLRKNL